MNETKVLNPDYPNEDVLVEGYPHEVRLSTYDSVPEFAKSALRRGKDGPNMSIHSTDVANVAHLALNGGLKDDLPEVLALATEAVTFIEAEHITQGFGSAYDVSGSDVEVGRYCSGDPEHMVDYPLAPVTRMGKVISLICSTDAMSCVSGNAIRQRGIVLTALALALERMGYATEFWSDMGAYFGRSYGSYEYHSRIRIKATDELLDPAMIMLAYCDSRMLRGLQFCAEDGWPPSANSDGGSRDVLPDGLPDGMIVISDPMLGEGEPIEELKGFLKRAGLIAE